MNERSLLGRLNWRVAGGISHGTGKLRGVNEAELPTRSDARG